MENILQYFDPFALLFVWAGTLIVVSLQEGLPGLVRSIRAFRVIFRADPIADAQRARQTLLKVRNITELKGLQCIDHVKTDSHFIGAAVTRLANCPDRPSFTLWVSNALNDREERHNSVIRFWLTIADIAPAMGMVGTIFGLVRLFNDAGNSSELGAAMALALMTTLYGLVLANIIAAPIAQRLLRLSSEELKWQRILTDKLILLSEEEAIRGHNVRSLSRAAG